MPTYEYKCTKCAHTFEQFQSMTAEPVKRCPKCKGKVKRLIGRGAGIIFKGSGFYATDYREKSEKPSCPIDKDRSEGCKSCPNNNG
ncbi:MAG: FmdB family zinc ribbon protein [Candidatus Omnitrophota bacterium]